MTAHSNATEITSVELKQRLDRGDKLDDRRRPRAERVPDQPDPGLGADSARRGARRYAELDPDDEIVVHCKMGGRSAKAADFLRSVGFKQVLNLKGGILDWIDKVDPTPAEILSIVT